MSWWIIEWLLGFIAIIKHIGNVTEAKYEYLLNESFPQFEANLQIWWKTVFFKSDSKLTIKKIFALKQQEIT